jgi:hypothetical protein
VAASVVVEVTDVGIPQELVVAEEVVLAHDQMENVRRYTLSDLIVLRFFALWESLEITEAVGVGRW